jgi:hypothetical protein
MPKSESDVAVAAMVGKGARLRDDVPLEQEHLLGQMHCARRPAPA